MGVSDLYLSWPAVSQICRLIFLLSISTLVVTKAAPIVGSKNSLNFFSTLLYIIDDFPTLDSPKNTNLKVLFIAQDDESIAYGPSIDNIYYSDYPIRLPFYIVYNIAETEQLYPLINVLLSDSVADIIAKNDFYPIPKVVREKLVIDLQLYLQENED